uniref:Uncharacterized protein n=1 Tax=Globisporangium ultimum (strain ATCC 200006 / CBS 805.95 / DAOM BR144) TaxID=431595 RepID=K3XAK5_GLOUD
MATASFNVRELLELERQLYQESIDRTQQQHTELLRGSLEAFVVRCIPFEDEKGWETEAAMVQLQLNKRNGLDLLEFELKQAEDVHQAREELKQQLLANAHRRLRRVQSRLQSLREAATNSNAVTSSSPMQRKRRQREVPTPSPTKDALSASDEEDVGRQTLLHEVHDVQRRAQKAFNLRHLVDGLPSAARVVDDVFAEMEKLQQHLSAKAAASQDASQGVRIDVNTEDQVLDVYEKADARVPDATFRVNDFVVLSSRLSEEDFYGQVAAIAKHELHVVLVCGTKACVTTYALQTQQCTLRHQPQRTYESLLLLGYDERTILDTKQIRLDAQLRKKGKRKRTLDIRRGF